MKNIRKILIPTALTLVLIISTVACGGSKDKIVIDGSSTVYPISEAMAEGFKEIDANIETNIGRSGTGGGMKKFVAGEIDICNASRTMKDKEKEEAKKNGIEYVELKVAFDGISVVVNKDNDWAESITVDELKKIWEPNSSVKKWSDVRPEWPNEEIKLYGPGTDSGTFEYFTEEINDEANAIRTDFTPSEDDNVLVTGVTNDKYAMGYFGYSYYLENKDLLKVLAIDGGNSPVLPDFDTIENGTYNPLSRPLFIYVNKKSLEKEHIKKFIEYYLTEGTKFIKEVGYVSLKEADYKIELEKIK
ncbi:MAG: PstS family phosphate ABC transporter substrate-binding protein [Bacillota bacterium]